MRAACAQWCALLCLSSVCLSSVTEPSVDREPHQGGHGASSGGDEGSGSGGGSANRGADGEEGQERRRRDRGEAEDDPADDLLNDPVDYYELLGVGRNVGARELKKAYRRLALRWHPDKLRPFVDAAAEKAAERRFMRLATAHEVLADPERRARYDAHGPEGGAGSGGDGNTDAFGRPIARQYTHARFDMLIRFEGGAFEFHYRPPAMRKMPDTTLMVEVTLAELFTGVNKTVTGARPRLCPHCGGTRADDTSDAGFTRCERCAGTGHATYLREATCDGAGRAGEDEHGHDHDHDHSHGHDDHHHEQGHGHCHGGAPPPLYAHAVNTTCHVCNGTGRIPVTPCPVCGGHGVLHTPFTKVIVVPAGAPVGHTITFEGEGAEAPPPGWLPGNLVFIVSMLPVVPEGRFLVFGKNVVHKARVGLVDALLGFNRTLTLPTGRVLAVVHDGVAQSLRFPHEGLPEMEGPAPGEDGHDEARGDVVVEFDIVFPRRLGAEERRRLSEDRGGGEGALMDDAEIAMLEKVVRLAASADEEYQPTAVELAATRQCDAVDPLRCLLDPLEPLLRGRSPPAGGGSAGSALSVGDELYPPGHPEGGPSKELQYLTALAAEAAAAARAARAEPAFQAILAEEAEAEAAAERAVAEQAEADAAEADAAEAVADVIMPADPPLAGTGTGG